MAYEKLILLAPCHGLEDFPLYHTGEDAASLLACWTALWHPLFLHSANNLPQIERCEYPTDEIENALLVLPKPCESELDADLPALASSKNANLIQWQHQREAILDLALERYGDAAGQLDAELVADFLAFGFAFLQVEVLTQQMRYASSIDQGRIARDIKAAAAALVEGDHDACREKLTLCHDALADERNHYYPVEVYLIDLTMLDVAESTLGATLDQQLQSRVPQNFLATAQTIEKLAEFNDSALQTIRHRIAEGNVGLAGGEYEELPLPLMSFDTALSQLALGRECYERHLGQAPQCFGRRRNGMYPTLAHVIRHAGYERALHLKFDEGKMPEAGQGKTLWSVANRELLDCYARSPLDANDHATFLNLPSHLSDTMDTDHVATRMFIHWPGYVAPWYEDLRRCDKYGSALGKFVTLKEYFDNADDYSNKDEFQPDDFVYPHLKQAASRSDAVSRTVTYWQQEVHDMGQRGLQAISAALGSASPTTDTLQKIQTGLGLTPSNAQTIVNPYSFARRMLVRGEELGHGESVYASGRQSDGQSATLVDVPAMGFATIRYGGMSSKAEKAATTAPNIGDGLTLRNEFFQATIDPTTGSLRSMKDYRGRKTRLSQQLAFRITLPKTGQAWVDAKAPAAYSVMAADSVELTANGQIFAEITARGRLLALNGEEVGNFEQLFRVTRGNRVMDVEIELTTNPELLLEDPWDSYYTCRFAFADEAAILRCGSRLQVHDASRRRMEAPLFVDIDSADRHTTILTGGLPYHRRSSDAKLDTLLAVLGEQQTRFRIGVGVDLPAMTRSAIDFLARQHDPLVMPGHANSETGWLLHVDARNCVIPWWHPLADESGLRLRMVETDGRRTTAHLRTFRPLKGAWTVDASGTVLEELAVNDGVAEVAVEPNWFGELKLIW